MKKTNEEKELILIKKIRRSYWLAEKHYDKLVKILPEKYNDRYTDNSIKGSFSDILA